MAIACVGCRVWREDGFVNGRKQGAISLNIVVQRPDHHSPKALLTHITVPFQQLIYENFFNAPGTFSQISFKQLEVSERTRQG